ncbi:DUF4132 domain-containing protein [Spirillospora sp. NPDC047279]|uniref:DUF4132 domain-containing protein n=1 Tax=Spirillospora sp. NPDC047279 TaxID=3155478 RepID=UPI0033EC8A1C
MIDNEDRLVLPDSWHKHLHPRRGGLPGPAVKVSRKAPDAVRAYNLGASAHLESTFAHPGSAPELVERAREYLAGRTDPTGAAVVTATLAARPARPGDLARDAHLDAWVAEHGVGFASRAVAELSTIFVAWNGWDRSGGHRDLEVRFRRSGDHLHQWWMEAAFLRRLRTILAEGIGPALAPLLIAGVGRSAADDLRLQAEALAALPSDEAFAALVERLDTKHVQPAVLEAARRFPVRALRLLAPEAGGTSKAAGAAGELLAGHVQAHRRLAEQVLPALPEGAREVVERILKESERAPDAPVSALPSLLREPPWTRERAAAAPAVVAGLTPSPERAVSWAPGEREAWAASARPATAEDADWDAEVLAFREGTMQERPARRLLLHGPEELVRPLLADWRPRHFWYTDDWLPALVARFELDALPHALEAADANPAGNAHVLVPFLDAEAARLAANWLARLKSARPAARAWFARHGAAGVLPLVPAALGRAGRARREAESALLLVAAESGADPIVQAARDAHGPEAAAAVAALLATDPLDLLPPRIPEAGAWADPAVLPQLFLKDGRGALPDEATAHVVTMLALSKPGEVYAGVDAVRAFVTPESLARFSWGVFRRWQAAGAPAKEGWAFTQLGRLGDDETVRALTPIIRAWPGEGGHQKAVAGLEVLAEIGTEVALMHLHGIAQRVKFKGLRTRAQEKIDEVASGLGLTPERLADRLVPDFGLDAQGSMTLDYGPRRFSVGFDEQLRPYVTDEDGTPRKALPKPGAKDDPELAPAAYKAFGTLKKDVRTVAADQVRRLEESMVTRRRWAAAEFRDLLAAHPLLRHIMRRLVWLSVDGGETTAFRLAEDGTFADVEDDLFTPPATAAIGVAHPLELGDALPAWAGVFADYEILQPFPQLGRPVHALTAEERASGRLTRFEGFAVPFGRVLALTKRGWERGIPLDAGVERWISRAVPGGRYVVIDLDPGFSVGLVDHFPEQGLEHVWISDRPADFLPRVGTPYTFGELDAVTASEILADLTTLSEG